MLIYPQSLLGLIHKVSYDSIPDFLPRVFDVSAEQVLRAKAFLNNPCELRLYSKGTTFTATDGWVGSSGFRSADTSSDVFVDLANLSGSVLTHFRIFDFSWRCDWKRGFYEGKKGGGKRERGEARKYCHVVSFCFWKLKRLKEVNITFRQTWSCRSVYPTPDGALCAGQFSIYLCKKLSRPLVDYLPRGRYGYVQITSRDNSLGYRLIEGSHDPIQVSGLERLGRPEARSLLQRKLLGGNELRNEEADELTDALGVFPSYNNSGCGLFERD